MGDSIVIPYQPGQEPATAASLGPQTESPQVNAQIPEEPVRAWGPQYPDELQVTHPQVSGNIPEYESMQGLDKMRQESIGYRMYHGVLNALGGKFEDNPVVTDHGVQMQTAAATPGSQWKRIIAGAITGAAGGLQAAGTGPGANARALGGGIQAGANMMMNAHKQQMEEANTQFNQQQQAAMQSAQVAHLNTENVMLTLQASKMQMDANKEITDIANTTQDLLTRGGPGSEWVGHFPDVDSMMAAAKDNPSLHDEHAGGPGQVQLHYVDRYKDGPNGTKIHDGVDAYRVTPDWKTSKYPFDIHIRQKTGWDSKTNEPIYEERTIPAKSVDNETAYTWMTANGNEQKQDAISKAEIGSKNAEASKVPSEIQKNKAEGAAAYANARDANAKARQTDLQTDYLIKNGVLPGRDSPKRDQELAYGPGGWSGMQKFLSSKEVQGANASENMYQAFMKAYADYKSGANTGAPGMVGFSDHLGATFGNIQGGRYNKTLIEDHLGARSISDDAVAFLQKFTNGDPITPNQWEAFRKTVEESRQVKWDTVNRLAKAQERPLERIGFPDDLAKTYGVGQGQQGQQQQQPGSGKNVSLAAAKALEMNKGLSDEQITNAAKNLGYTVTP